MSNITKPALLMRLANTSDFSELCGEFVTSNFTRKIFKGLFADFVTGILDAEGVPSKDAHDDIFARISKKSICKNIFQQAFDLVFLEP
ncbi:hypothetical protein OAT11_01545 [Nitrospinaceae bacterium]|nr:hypothetical protein [Nitrospinaceae bacterium]